MTDRQRKADNPDKSCKLCGQIHNTKQDWCPDCREGVPDVEFKEANLCVLYFHVDADGDVVYVGEGSTVRAYAYRGSMASRLPAHSRWVFEQLKKRNLNDVIQIKEQHLSKKEARDMEKQYIRVLQRRGHSLRFNKQGK